VAIVEPVLHQAGPSFSAEQLLSFPFNQALIKRLLSSLFSVENDNQSIVQFFILAFFIFKTLVPNA